MAIDWGRVAKGVATGYLGAKIANTEANDAMNADIIKRAGLNFVENTLPEFQKKETSRKETYNKVRGRYSSDVAEYMDQNGFITGDPNDYANIVEMLGANNNYNETQLKAYLEAADAGTYTERAEKRVTGIQDREKTIMNLTSGSSKIGNMTADLLIDGGKEIGTEQTVTTPAVEGSQVGPVITEAVPEKTEPVKLPSFEEIFGDTAGDDRVYLNLSREDKMAIKKLSNTEFDKNFEDKLTGDTTVPEMYNDDYKALPEADQKRVTLEQYARQRYFTEVFLPQQGYTYSGSETKSEPSAVTKARMAINHNKSIGNDAGADEAREILKSLGYEPTDYGL